jgi:hypothetical protein
MKLKSLMASLRAQSTAIPYVTAFGSSTQSNVLSFYPNDLLFDYEIHQFVVLINQNVFCNETLEDIVQIRRQTVHLCS